MSSSCRKAASYTLLASLGAAPAAWAQQTFFVPQIETSAEWNSNRELTPVASQEDASKAYKVAAEARMGQRSQRSDIEFRPRVVFQDFPDRSGIDPLDVFADLRGERRTQRGTYGVFARYERQDTYNAEYGTARFDELDPNNPPNGDTGIVLTGDTRTRARIEPSLEYALSERNLIGAHINFDTVDYGRQLAGSLVGYDAEYIDVTLIRQMGPRTELSVGPYFEHYENDLGGKADATGVVFGVQHEWSEVSSTNVLIRAESTDSEDPTATGATVSDKTTNWGIEISGRQRYRVGGLRYTLGRFLEPSSVGSRRETDSFRVQFDRPLSARLGFFSALRYTIDRQIGTDDLGVNNASKRERAYGELFLRGDLTREWYVLGGYRYGMLDTQSTFGRGENHGVYISFGYQGLRPPNR
jgi:hypothetical protein